MDEDRWGAVARAQERPRFLCARDASAAEAYVDAMLDDISRADAAADDDAPLRALRSRLRRDRRRDAVMRREVAPLARMGSPFGAAEDAALARLALRAALAGVARLDAAIAVAVGGGATAGEVAAEVGLAEAAVRKRVSRLRAALRAAA